MTKSPIGRLRLISMLEGISFLLLLCIGMPLKYKMDLPLPNRILGMTHGLLTIVFVVALVNIYLDQKLSAKMASKTFIASLIPFGAFIMEAQLKKLPQE